tara:strand:- start:777 stop:1100 length:324 start_codon:yes stop_codon:yes gene_type:complete
MIRDDYLIIIFFTVIIISGLMGKYNFHSNLVQSIIYFISFSIIIYWITNREDISIISGLIALCVLYIAKIYKNKKFLFEKYYNCKCYHKQNCSCWDYVEDGECDSCK